MKSVRIQSYSGPHFPVFGLNTERSGVSLRIQSERGKMRTRITPNMDTFYAMQVFSTIILFRELESLETFYRIQEKETILYGFKTHSHHKKSSSNPLMEHMYTISIDLRPELLSSEKLYHSFPRPWQTSELHKKLVPRP